MDEESDDKVRDAEESTNDMWWSQKFFFSVQWMLKNKDIFLLNENIVTNFFQLMKNDAFKINLIK